MSGIFNGLLTVAGNCGGGGVDILLVSSNLSNVSSALSVTSFSIGAVSSNLGNVSSSISVLSSGLSNVSGNLSAVSSTLALLTPKIIKYGTQAVTAVNHDIIPVIFPIPFPTGMVPFVTLTSQVPTDPLTLGALNITEAGFDLEFTNSYGSTSGNVEWKAEQKN